MTASVLKKMKCPVCGAPCSTDESGKRFYCLGEKSHSFDFAKSGYLNLSLSGNAGGDSKEAVRARSAFLEAGYYQILSDRVNGLLDEIKAESVLDAGCGEGYYTNRMAKNRIVLGADLSKYGVEHGAKQAKKLGTSAMFAVAGLFDLPVKDASFDAVTNLFAPCAEEEFERILKPSGHLIVVGAGERHLFGLKKAVYDRPYLNTGRNDLPKHLTLCRKETLVDSVEVVGADAIEALFSMTPYYWKTSEEDHAKLKKLDRLQTEIEFDIYLYRKDA